eukprot:6444943-Amphidinium_carterae.1
MSSDTHGGGVLHGESCAPLGPHALVVQDVPVMLNGVTPDWVVIMACVLPRSYGLNSSMRQTLLPEVPLYAQPSSRCSALAPCECQNQCCPDAYRRDQCNSASRQDQPEDV